MKYKTWLIYGMLGTTMSLYARLGDTPQESVIRFGNPLETLKDKYAEAGLYERQHYVVFVIYRDGRAVRETYALISPKTRKELCKEHRFYGLFKILNDPSKLVPLSEKQIAYLRKVNLPANWKSYDTGDKDIDGQYAELGRRKVRGDYYAKRHVLVITEESAPAAPKAAPAEIKQAKASGGIPAGSYFKRYMDKYGSPFKVSGGWGVFQQHNIVLYVNFNNCNEIDFSHRKRDITYSHLIRSVTGKKSCSVDYKLMQARLQRKYDNTFTELKQLNYKYRNEEKIDVSDYQEIWNREAKVSYQLTLTENLQSIRPDIVDALLEGMTETKWRKIRPRTINGEWYSTWKDGRRLYAIYDIALKYLHVELGMKSKDYDQDAIKKAGKKNNVEALKMF